MSGEATASVTIDSAAPAPPAPRPMTVLGKILSVFSMLLAFWASRTLWVTILGVHVLYKIYWVADQAIYTFRESWQAQAHVQLFGIMFASVSGIVLGYLGFTKGSTGIAGFVQSTFSRSTTQPGETRNRNTRADRDE